MTQERDKKIMELVDDWLNSATYKDFELCQDITALFSPEWKRYPENVPEVEKDYTLTVEVDGKDRSISSDRWVIDERGIGYWYQFIRYARIKVIAFTDPIEPYNPEKL